jgi:hypothetical protein
MYIKFLDQEVLIEIHIITNFLILLTETNGVKGTVNI